MIKKYLLGNASLVLLLFLVTGCSGKLQTTFLGQDFKLAENPYTEDGVLIRITEPQREYYRYTAIKTTTTGKGMFLSRYCNHQLMEKIVYKPSNKLYVLAYKPALFFEKHKFMVTLHDDGTVKSINSESTPASPTEIGGLIDKAAAAKKTFTTGLGQALSSAIATTSTSSRAEPLCDEMPILIKRCPLDNDNCKPPELPRCPLDSDACP